MQRSHGCRKEHLPDWMKFGLRSSTGPTVTVGLLATATPKETALDN